MLLFSGPIVIRFRSFNVLQFRNSYAINLINEIIKRVHLSGMKEQFGIKMIQIFRLLLPAISVRRRPCGRMVDIHTLNRVVMGSMATLVSVFFNKTHLCPTLLDYTQ